MKYLIAIIVFAIYINQCQSQNLIPNGDFEIMLGCPSDLSQIDSLNSWFNPSVGGNTGGTPDYFHSCSVSNAGVPANLLGTQQARSGLGYAGIYLYAYVPLIVDWREYLEVQLISPLTSNETYYFEMYISLAEICQYTTDAIGVFFSNTAIQNINNWHPLPLTPQLSNTSGNVPNTANWTLVSGYYTALGGESYIIIGNFNDDPNTNLVLFDSTALLPRTYVYIDDVSLETTTGMPESIEEYYSVFPIPCLAEINFTTTMHGQNEITIYNVLHTEILQTHFTSNISINTYFYSKGIYTYQIKFANGLIKYGKFSKN